MFAVEATLWRVFFRGGQDVLFRRPTTKGWDCYSCQREYSYVVESRGELLWVSVQVQFGYQGILLRLREGEGKKPWLVNKDPRSLADRVIFLGTPNSFALDSSRFAGNVGGWAYFVHDYKDVFRREPVGVFGDEISSQTRLNSSSACLEDGSTGGAHVMFHSSPLLLQFRLTTVKLDNSVSWNKFNKFYIFLLS
jgi:hypothetical protein